jgi:hypothetical protein
MEINALIKVVQILKPAGKALVIIPDGILESPSLSPIREWFIKNCEINFIVSLPKFAFAPYTKEKTYAVSFTKRVVPYNTVDEEDLKNERFWAYIIDNDGYANSDKRFVTDLTDKSGKWLHNELSYWYDEKGTLHKSLLEEKYGKSGKEQGDNEKYYDEWDNLIEGKKYGFVTMEKVLEEYSITYPKIGNLRSFIKDASITVVGLENELDNFLKLLDGKGKLIAEINLDEFGELFDLYGISYDEDENTFYDMQKPIKTHQINILPEKYFRIPKIVTISLDELRSEVESIQNEIKLLLQGAQ